MQNSLWSAFCSPRHLMVFEAAARCGSFTRAAIELNVQQPAVSMTVRQIEERLGMTLFVRAHRKTILTAAGERLFADVTGAFDLLDRSAIALRQMAGRNHVTLNASSAFNTYWMLPRISSFADAHPDIDLRLQSSDREPDIDAEGIDLAIRRGYGTWRGCESVLIAQEVIRPVAAPRLAQQAGSIAEVTDFLSQRLIHLEEPVRERPGWHDWFGHFGCRAGLPSAGLRLNDYALVLQAAMAGEGFAFGWRHLTDALVSLGLLADLPQWQWTTGAGFYLVWSTDRALSEEAGTVRDWLITQRDLGVMIHLLGSRVR
jgi:DNA-binding transcriptional LysR family regulator